MPGREGHTSGTKKRKIVKDSKGNAVKDSKGNAVTSNDYSKSSTKSTATKKKTTKTTKASSKPKTSTKKAASKPKAKAASSGPSKRPNNKPKTRAKSSGPSKRPNNKPKTKTPSKSKTYVSSGRGTVGNGAFPGGPRGRVQRTKAAISKGGDSSSLSPKYQRRVSKSVKRDAKRGVTNLSKPKRVGKRSDRRGNR